MLALVQTRIAILRHAIWFAGLWICLLAWCGNALAQAPEQAARVPLTEAAAVRALSPAEAAEELPVKLRGVVTYFDPVRRFAFLQDATAGIFFYPGALAEPNPLALSVGELVEIEGFTWPGGYAPTVEAGGGRGLPVEAKSLGKGPLPQPMPMPWNALNDDNFHNRYVEMRAVVRKTSVDAAMANLVLELSTRGGLVKAFVPGFDGITKAVPENWIDMEVRLHGVFSVGGNPQRQRSELRLFVQTLDRITPDFAGVGSAFAAPARPFHTLMRFDPDALAEKRVRVEGVVTHVEPGRGVYLREAQRGLWLQSPQSAALAPGDRVAAIGFVAAADRPVLLDAILRKLESGPAPEPLTLTSQQARSGIYHASFVQIDGEVLGDSQREGTRVFVVEADGRKFRAELAGTAGAPPPPKSWVRVSGICLNFPPVPGPAMERPSDFHILLRTAADVTILRAAPWGTPQRIGTLIGTLLMAMAATAVWVLMLRRRVAAQTAVIQQKLEREVIWEERNRIARELHDTLEQQLAGITIQLEATRARLPGSPEAARESLVTMQAMIQHSRGEARRSVWDLRSHTLEQRGLVAALQEVAGTLVEGGGHRVAVRTTGAERRLDRQIEFHLLRVAQEAMTNAMKHGRAAEVSVGIQYAEDSVRLVVRDNGRGFDNAVPPPNGAHFGLLGMRERAAKLRGELRIESTPGAGTTISLSVGTTTPQPSQRGGIS